MMTEQEVTEAQAASRQRLAELEDQNDYETNKWFQQMTPVRTCCFRCRVDSPAIHVAMPGTGKPALAMGEKLHRGEVDISGQVIEAFGALGWRFEKRRAYCPTCKGLG